MSQSGHPQHDDATERDMEELCALESSVFALMIEKQDFDAAGRVEDELDRKLDAFVINHPDCPEGWLMLGDYAGLSGSQDNLTHYRKALELAPLHPEANVEVARTLRGGQDAEVQHLLEVACAHCVGYFDERYVLETVAEVATEYGFSDLRDRARAALAERFPQEE